MKTLLLAFLLALAGVLFFAIGPDEVSPGSVSWVNDTASWVKEISPKIQNDLVAETADIKKTWENADRWGEEMSSKVGARLKKEFEQLTQNSPTAGKHERENANQPKPE